MSTAKKDLEEFGLLERGDERSEVLDVTGLGVNRKRQVVIEKELYLDKKPLYSNEFAVVNCLQVGTVVEVRVLGTQVPKLSFVVDSGQTYAVLDQHVYGADTIISFDYGHRELPFSPAPGGWIEGLSVDRI